MLNTTWVISNAFCSLKRAKRENGDTVSSRFCEIQEQAKLNYGNESRKKEGEGETALGMMEMSYVLIDR